MRSWVSWAILVLALAGSSPVWAESSEAGDESVPEWAEDGRNEIAIVIGITDVADDPGPSLNFDFTSEDTAVVAGAAFGTKF